MTSGGPWGMGRSKNCRIPMAMTGTTGCHADNTRSSGTPRSGATPWVFDNAEDSSAQNFRQLVLALASLWPCWATELSPTATTPCPSETRGVSTQAFNTPTESANSHATSVTQTRRRKRWRGRSVVYMGKRFGQSQSMRRGNGQFVLDQLDRCAVRRLKTLAPSSALSRLTRGARTSLREACMSLKGCFKTCHLVFGPDKNVTVITVSCQETCFRITPALLSNVFFKQCFLLKELS